MKVDLTQLSGAVLIGSVIVGVVMIFCTWILASMLSACRSETAKIRKWFTEGVN